MPDTSCYRGVRDSDTNCCGSNRKILSGYYIKVRIREKKLKDYLIDAKVPQHQRDALVVIADENTVYAVFGLEISEKVKITQDTEKILYLAVLN